MPRTSRSRSRSSDINYRKRERCVERFRGRGDSRERAHSRSRYNTSEKSRSRSRNRSRRRVRSRGYTPEMSGRSSRGRSRQRKRKCNRSRSRSRSSTRRSRSRSRRSRSRSRRSHSRRDVSVKQALNSIISRLNAIEENSLDESQRSLRPGPLDTSQQSLNAPSVSSALVELLGTAIKNKSQNYFVSNFDPLIHDIAVWCEEVERAKVANGWGDTECLSRVSNCLKGDAKTWLNEWVTNDRSWTNFRLEFTPLCPRKLDYANILYEVMNTTSDKYSTYAEYARRSLLRLRIVKGLSNDLMVQIIIRGITDPQVRAAAANAELSVENLVSFLSIYVKPARTKLDSRLPSHFTKSRKVGMPAPKCHTCGRIGHKSFTCLKKLDAQNNSRQSESATKQSAIPTCTFCKMIGHKESNCFFKERSEARNNNNQNRKRLFKASPWMS
ncbi:uncharacterized protein [Epargyreus clarus]|uniref:uncharacterized protein n=1 Tax=Epargyreus clarus TaxID=520877 RepID=UPI003C2C5FFE